MALMQGVMKVEAGAALSVGDVVGSDTQGRAITSTGAANDYELGVALDAATDAGQIIRVLLKSAAQI